MKKNIPIEAKKKCRFVKYSTDSGYSTSIVFVRFLKKTLMENSSI